MGRNNRQRRAAKHSAAKRRRNHQRPEGPSAGAAVLLERLFPPAEPPAIPSLVRTQRPVSSDCVVSSRSEASTGCFALGRRRSGLFILSSRR